MRIGTAEKKAKTEWNRPRNRVALWKFLFQELWRKKTLRKNVGVLVAKRVEKYE